MFSSVREQQGVSGERGFGLASLARFQILLSRVSEQRGWDLKSREDEGKGLEGIQGKELRNQRVHGITKEGGPLTQGGKASGLGSPYLGNPKLMYLSDHHKRI